MIGIRELTPTVSGYGLKLSLGSHDRDPGLGLNRLREPDIGFNYDRDPGMGFNQYRDPDTNFNYY